MGLYVIAVKCEEYRNGIKIGEVVRDITVPVFNCPFVSLNENILENNTLVYPNPSMGLINIEITEPTFLIVYNVNGVQVYSKQLLETNNKIDLTLLNKGLYLFKFNTKEKQFYKKVVVK